ncbi:gamma-glutamylcyclotransferase family protein [Ramlibacter humi]|uniref:Gamma-glutamylcyclotransferase family protein n=1 Tax=Ramlibacter humi TaxID=2530451 RepID=A0A4Z0C8R9_9BURK|nr:gamma-glutamylcyclotransferase family protein [Ramlibacter humi]TFZ07691.1 gamma-glutamylcyclotransferase [Ramlibacter humi]
MAASHLVFVFGTLKEDFPNHATNRGVRVPGIFRTCTPYPLYLVGERHSPWMVDLPGQGHPVNGQLFRVDDETLAAMDRLERVSEPDGYRRVLLDFEGGEPPGRRQAHVYLKPAGQLTPSDIRVGPLAEYSLEHAALYRPRS